MLVRLAVEVKLNGTRQSHPRGTPPTSAPARHRTRACASQPTLEKAVSTRGTQPSALQLNRQSKDIHVQLSPPPAFSKWQYGASSSTLNFATIFNDKNTLPLLLCESNWASPTPVSSHSLSRQRYSLERCEQSSTYCYASPTCGAGVSTVCTPPRCWIPSNSTIFGTATDSAALGGRGRSTTRISGSS